jgi:hypothetical protein
MPGDQAAAGGEYGAPKLAMTGDTMISEVLRFVEIDDETRARGHEIWELVAPHAETIVASFYEKARAFDIGNHFTDATIERLKAKQMRHWASLFGSRFDQVYERSVFQVGIRHRDIALNPMWYILGYAVLKISFTEVIAEAALPPIRKGRLMKALDKYVALDMALALSTYGAVVFD